MTHEGENNEGFAESLTWKLPSLIEGRNALMAYGLSLKYVRKPVTIYKIFGKKDKVTVTYVAFS